MSKNTIQRIVSALVMVLIAGLCVYFGENSTRVLVFIVGAIVNGEIIVNLFKRERTSVAYIATQLIYAVGFVLSYGKSDLEKSFVILSLLINIVLIAYLFFMSMKENFMATVENKFPVLSVSMTLSSMLTLSYLISLNNWRLLLVLLLIVNFGMDTGAWFFGKNFGKNKLWPKISPKKTREGLLGGMLVSGVLGQVFVMQFFQSKVIWIFIPFALLGFLSQIGDLIQSKIKRQFNVKDSSALIPGHGGMYDRIDSLIFVLPFFVIVMEYFKI